MNQEVKYDVHDMPKPGLLLGLSFQHLFAMFGATVLVPILVGIDPAVALFSSGLGTLAHLMVTKYKIPAYMGSWCSGTGSYHRRVGLFHRGFGCQICW